MGHFILYGRLGYADPSLISTCVLNGLDLIVVPHQTQHSVSRPETEWLAAQLGVGINELRVLEMFASFYVYFMSFRNAAPFVDQTRLIS